MDNFGSSSTPGATPWDKVLAEIRPSVNPGAFETWFTPTRLVRIDSGTLKVSVPNELFAEWLRTQYMATIRSALPKAGVEASEVEFVTAAQDAARTPATVDSPIPPRLNPRYTFDHFVVSSCNQFAHAASLAVADQPGGTYNPLFLYGGVGLGKTHLMQAIGNRLIRLRPGIRLRYLTSEQFMNDLITAIRFEETTRFRERYRSVEVLLVDDIQFLAGKESTQEEFFHTFNALHDAGHQIVIASDCPPRSIPALEERLRSRFEWGLLADIQPPDLETKVAILNKMASVRGWSVASEVAFYIASNIHNNIRELEGCLTTLMAASSVKRHAPDLALAREVIRTLVPAEHPAVTIDAVLRVVARHFELKVPDLKSRTNAHRIAFPRQIAMYLCKKLARESLPAIGAAFGGKHHTTVLHAVKKIEALRQKDPAVDARIRQTEQELQ